MHAKHLQNLLNADADKRFDTAITNITDREALWTAADTSGLLKLSAGTGQTTLPVWQSKELAGYYLQATDAPGSLKPHEMDLTDFLYQTVPQLIESGTEIAVMPVPGRQSAVCSPQLFAAELANYAYEAYGDEYELDYLKRRASPKNPKLP